MKGAISHPCKICTSKECAFGAILSHLLSTFSGRVQWFISSCEIANSQIMYTPNSDHLKGFISHRTTLHAVTLFFFFDFAWGGDMKHTKLLIFLFHKPFQSSSLDLIQPRAMVLHLSVITNSLRTFMWPGYLFSLDSFAWSGLKFGQKAEMKPWETEFQISRTY